MTFHMTDTLNLSIVHIDLTSRSNKAKDRNFDSNFEQHDEVVREWSWETRRRPSNRCQLSPNGFDMSSSMSRDSQHMKRKRCWNRFPRSWKTSWLRSHVALYCLCSWFRRSFATWWIVVSILWKLELISKTKFDVITHYHPSTTPRSSIFYF